MQDTQVRSLGQDDSLEKQRATTPVFLPGKSRQEGFGAWQSAVRGVAESDMTKQLSTQEVWRMWGTEVGRGLEGKSAKLDYGLFVDGFRYWVRVLFCVKWGTEEVCEKGRGQSCA